MNLSKSKGKADKNSYFSALPRDFDRFHLPRLIKETAILFKNLMWYLIHFHGYFSYRPVIRSQMQESRFIFFVPCHFIFFIDSFENKSKCIAKIKKKQIVRKKHMPINRSLKNKICCQKIVRGVSEIRPCNIFMGNPV